MTESTDISLGEADARLTALGLFAEAYAGLEAQGAAQLAEHGVSSVEFELLIRLARSPESRLRMTDLAAQASVTVSGVTRVVDRLVARGLVDRAACLTDRRATYAVLTTAGRALIDRALPGHLAFIDTWLTGPLAESGELDAFVAALRRLRDRLAPCATAGSVAPPQAAAGRRTSVVPSAR